MLWKRIRTSATSALTQRGAACETIAGRATSFFPAALRRAVQCVLRLAVPEEEGPVGEALKALAQDLKLGD